MVRAPLFLGRHTLLSRARTRCAPLAQRCVTRVPAPLNAPRQPPARRRLASLRRLTSIEKLPPVSTVKAAKAKTGKPRAAKLSRANGVPPAAAGVPPAATNGTAEAARMPQSAAMPSPFPPIADYAFLSDCHTGALVAPDGAIDWLCVPRFDAPSIFGTLLDRQAGTFRFGPFGINVPSARIYEPGTNTLITTWKTPSGWVLVRDALTIGPRRGVDLVTPHTRPPADQDGDHMLVRVALCLDGEVDMELICEPVFDYGRTPAQWSVTDEGHRADASAGELTIRLQTDLAVGIEGDWVRGRHTLKKGEQIYCALSWAEELAAPEDINQANEQLAYTTRFWRDWLGRARIPDHRWRDPIQLSALAIKGLTYMPTGATVAALTTSLPETTRDDLSGYAGASPVRVGNGAFDQRQNDVFGAALDSILLHTRRSERLPRRLWPIVQAPAECATAVWREPDQGIWEARGEPQHYVPSKIVCWVAVDRASRLAALRGDSTREETWHATAEEIRTDILTHGGNKEDR